MKNKILRFAAAALALVAAQVSFAQSNGDMNGEKSWYEAGNWYVGALGSANWMTKLKSGKTYTTDAGDTINNTAIKYKAGWGTGVKLGNTYFNPFRFELEGTFRRNKIKSVTVTTTAGASGTEQVSGHMKSYNLLANVFYDFEVMDDVMLYVGGGLGWTHFKAKALGGSSSSNVFAYQLMAGLDWHFAQDWSAFVGYKFFGTSRMKLKDENEKVKMKANFQNIIEAGVKFYF